MKNHKFDAQFEDAKIQLIARDNHCTMCGKQYSEWDAQEGFGFDYICGHGTKFEDKHIDINLCCSCFDKIMDFVIPMCKENPVSEMHMLGEIDYDSGDRLNRLDKVLNEDRAIKITEDIRNASDSHAALLKIEDELRKEGFDIDSIPLDRNSYWKQTREEYLKEHQTSEEN